MKPSPGAQALPVPSFAGRQLLLFDLDGTLVDSVPDLVAAVNRMLADLGRPAAAAGDVRNWVGNGAVRLVKRALVGALEGEPDAAEFARAMPLFLRYYAEENCRHSRPYPAARATLRRLASAGYRMACITNKPAAFTLPMLEQLELAEHFGLVVSGDSTSATKPDPAPLLYATDFFKVPPGQALMIGDSVNDIQAARAAGIPVVCVSYGYNHGHDIRGAGPDGVVDSLAELDELLES
ncbi:MAG TPA: phosphoglycolate phosphatase [Gammaproteobacteria bacterium]